MYLLGQQRRNVWFLVGRCSVQWLRGVTLSPCVLHPAVGSWDGCHLWSPSMFSASSGAHPAGQNSEVLHSCKGGAVGLWTFRTWQQQWETAEWGGQVSWWSCSCGWGSLVCRGRLVKIMWGLFLSKLRACSLHGVAHLEMSAAIAGLYWMQYWVSQGISHESMLLFHSLTYKLQESQFV